MSLWRFLCYILLYFAYTCLRSELEWSRNPTMLSSQTGHDGVLWGQRLHRYRKTWLYPVWQHFMIYVLIKPKLLQNMTATWAWSTLWAVYAASQVLKFLSLHLYEAPGGSLWKGESSQKRLSFSDSQRCKLPGADSWVYCLKEALARCMDRDKRTKQAAALFSALAFHTDHPTLRTSSISVHTYLPSHYF